MNGLLTKKEAGNLGWGLVFVSPWLAGLILFAAYPLLASLYYSFTDFSVLLPPVNVGLLNYRFLFQDDLFWTSMKNTVLFATMSVPLTLGLSLLAAMLLNNRLRMQGTFRAIYFLPSLVPLVPLAILWSWMFNSNCGLINAIIGPPLRSMGIEPPNWLEAAGWTKPALVFTKIWGIGGAMVIFLAALQEAPEHLYESADLDGAGAWRKFLSITLPFISPALYFNLIIGIIASLQTFALPYVMMGRGPSDSTYFLTMYIYDQGFKYLNMGYACAMAWIMFLIILILTLIASRISSRFMFYGEEKT